MTTSALHLTIYGRVQGVGFRAWLSAHAHNRRLRGWVRNRREGFVEVVICGDMVELETLHAACLHGPQAAKVEKVEVKPWTGAIPQEFEQWATV